MDDVDLLLSIVENPTRRRILESLSQEPSYPLRLSKELGVSQQAVTKNLTIMEESGLVVSSRVDSDMGPSRILYTPCSEFTLIVEMHESRFSARVYGPPGTADGASAMTEEDARRRLAEIDERMEELDEERAALAAERDGIVAGLGGEPQEEDVTDGPMEMEVRRYGE